ncbi:centromere protein X isoform X1 [Kogia breviceps]|uniref:centromere protein X isoform X1 n=1 Tax=Kogia breviceps TaxID=27615 RepID=UPI0034D2B25D
MEEIGTGFRKSAGMRCSSWPSCSRSSSWKRPSAASGRPRQRTWPKWTWSSWRRCCLSCFWTSRGFHPHCGYWSKSQPLASDRTGAAGPQVLQLPGLARCQQTITLFPLLSLLPAADGQDAADRGSLTR